MTETALKRTPLYDEHVKLGAKMVPFAGYEMPVQYPAGVLTEHNWTRQHAGLFDVSHMGQCFLCGPDFETVARALEGLVSGDILGLAPSQQRYTQLLNSNGGILDDMMVTRTDVEGRLYIVVNASRKETDYEYIESQLPPGVALEKLENDGLIALQGPEAESVLAKLEPKVRELQFMHSMTSQVASTKNTWISRSGYTGEDGFELSVGGEYGLWLWDSLLADERVKPIGLGARDSLRLEAGLCLYGHDIDETTSPVEADLLWSIAKRRRIEGGFPGAARIQNEIANGPSRKRVGIKPDGKAPAREGTIIQDSTGRPIGKITSGGFGPTVNGPVAMGYVETQFAQPGTAMQLIVRGNALPASVVKLPFVPARFKR